MQTWFYNQKLPHFQLPEATYFVTYRLTGSMPVSMTRLLQEEFIAKELQLQKKSLSSKDFYKEKQDLQFEYFQNTDQYLDKSLNEPYWLKQENVSQIVSDSLLHLSKTKVELWSYCIMPNHVHAVFNLREKDHNLFKVLQQHKSYTATQANKILKREGQFWERESYDHIIRPGMFEFIVAYVINNPVKAGFINKWPDWKWTYVNPLIIEAFL
jgi:REP element-mobilizing transposase RayT